VLVSPAQFPESLRLERLTARVTPCKCLFRAPRLNQTQSKLSLLDGLSTWPRRHRFPRDTTLAFVLAGHCPNRDVERVSRIGRRTGWALDHRCLASWIHGRLLPCSRRPLSTVNMDLRLPPGSAKKRNRKGRPLGLRKRLEIPLSCGFSPHDALFPCPLDVVWESSPMMMFAPT